MKALFPGLLLSSALLGCSDDPSAARPLQGPPGGILEVNNGGIPLAGSASGGSASGGGAGAGGSLPLGGDGMGASGAAVGGGGQPALGQAFLPDVPYEYVGKGPSGGLEVIASTLKQDDISGEWLVVVKNTGFNPICLVSVPADFKDANGTVLFHDEVFVHSPMWLSFDRAVPCLGTGDIGMAKSTVLQDIDFSKIAKVEHGFSGNINPDAEKITGVGVIGVTIEDFTEDAKQVTGKLHNISGRTWHDPKVWLYPVDGAGRPISEGFDIELVSVPNNTDWDFFMYVDLPIDQFVTFYEFDEQ